MFTVLLCTDGSELSQASLADGLRVVAAPERVVLAMAVAAVDPMVAFGTGVAGGAPMSAEDAQRLYDASTGASRDQLEEAARGLGLDNAEHVLLTGSAGQEICALAESLPASVIVLGTRGHGGLRRAVLGSVSDHVVRNAPCPVVITGPAAEKEAGHDA